MSLDVITHETVRDALRALRYAYPLVRSPLLGLEAVSLRLKAEDLADTGNARSWVLGRFIEQAVDNQLQRVRGTQPMPAAAQLTADDELAQLQRDLQSGSAERLNWALVHWRYLSPTRQSERDVGQALGMTERTVRNRVARGVAGLAEVLRQLEVEASRRRVSVDGVPAADRVIVDEQAAPQGVVEAMGELQALVNRHTEAVRLSPAQLEAVAHYPAAELTAYWLGRIAEWSLPRYRLDSRFVELSLLVDVGEESQSGRWQAKEERFTELRDLLAEVSEPAIVLLGPPGSGKSTLLRRLELDLACDALGDGGSTPLTFLISLNQYRPPTPGGPLPAPGDWLAARWAARYPKLPPLAELTASRGVVYLLDGLNEIPHRSAEEYRARIALWKQFLLEATPPGSGHRAVIACRSLDYSAPLSSPAMRVPQARLEPMTDEKVEAFLWRYSPATATALWEQLRGTAVVDALRWPFFLRMMVEAAAETGRWEGDLAALLTAYVRRALIREVERHNPRLEPNGLLDGRDYERIVSGQGWRDAYELPERGALFKSLSNLAHAMQEAAVVSESSQVRIAYSKTLEVLGGDGRNGGDDRGGSSAGAVIRVGVELGLLDEDRAADEVMFQHQLLQEYFAARKFVREPRVEMVHQPWRASEIHPSVREVLGRLGPADALPTLPTTGWEETVLMAAAMSDEPEAFIRAVMPVNLSLAGRAANLPAVRPRLGNALLDELRWALVHRSRDTQADLRARIDAGLALGWLGDPRFERRNGPHGVHLVPPMIEIPGGEYSVGEDEPIFDFEVSREERSHIPQHVVHLAPFAIGQFAVTNAEYACFMAAGGYDQERWWETEEARAWRSGEGTAVGPRRSALYGVRQIQKTPGLLESWHDSGVIDDEQFERWQRRLAMSAEELEAHLLELYPGGRETEPRYWRDERFNNPAQPVVGVSWYEARAFCAWLTAQTGQPYRLPSEVEREAAARGRAGRLIALGDDRLEPLAGNTFVTRLKTVSPVGVFVDADSPDGVSDLAGNTADWTLSLWGTEEDEPEYRYPYDKTDGREDVTANGDRLRVVRGGTWDSRNARLAAFRNWGLPSRRGDENGFRLLRETHPATLS